VFNKQLTLLLLHGNHAELPAKSMKGTVENGPKFQSNENGKQLHNIFFSEDYETNKLRSMWPPCPSQTGLVKKTAPVKLV